MGWHHSAIWASDLMPSTQPMAWWLFPKFLSNIVYSNICILPRDPSKMSTATPFDNCKGFIVFHRDQIYRTSLMALWNSTALPCISNSLFLLQCHVHDAEGHNNEFTCTTLSDISEQYLQKLSPLPWLNLHYFSTFCYEVDGLFPHNRYLHTSQ